MSLSPAEKASREAAAKREEEERAQQEAAMVLVTEEEHTLWLEARARSDSIEEEARWNAMQARTVEKRLTMAWRYQDHVYLATEEELRWGRTSLATAIVKARRNAADRYIATCEAEEAAFSSSLGQPPRSRERWELSRDRRTRHRRYWK